MSADPNACCCGGDAAAGHIVECPAIIGRPETVIAAGEVRFSARPGPWAVRGDAVVVDALGREVCTVDTGRNLEDLEASAIAHAIAALQPSR